MNFLNMEYFMAVAEEKSITKAAQRLYISQQALSAHIAKLEKEFGVTFFRRTSTFGLTAAGTQFLSACKRMMDIRRELDAEMDEIVKELRGELRIGISYTRGQALLPYLLEDFCQTHPLIALTLQEGNSVAMAELLQRGEIDLLISTAPQLPYTFDSIELGKERQYLIVPKRWMKERFGERVGEMRVAFEHGVRLSSFAEEPYIMLKRGDSIRTALDEALYREGITPHIRMETDNIQTAFSLASLGLGMTVYPEMFLQSAYTLSRSSWIGGIDCFPIQGMAIAKLYVAYSKMQRLSPAASAFILDLQKLLLRGDLLRIRDDDDNDGNNLPSASSPGME